MSLLALYSYNTLGFFAAKTPILSRPGFFQNVRTKNGPKHF